MTDITFAEIRKGDTIRVTTDISAGDRTSTLTVEGQAYILGSAGWRTAQGYTLAEVFNEGKSEITLLKRATPGQGAQIVVRIAPHLNVGGTYWGGKFQYIDVHTPGMLDWNPAWEWMYLTNVEISDKVKP